MLKCKDKYQAHYHWGRLGTAGDFKTENPTNLEQALAQYSKKFKEKTSLDWDDRYTEPKPRKYAFIEKDYCSQDKAVPQSKPIEISDGDSPEPPPWSVLAEEVKSLLELIFNESSVSETLTSIGFNKEKLPLGKLSEKTFTKGYECLNELANVLNDRAYPSREQAIRALSNQFYTHIPHISGPQRLHYIDSTQLLKRELKMLDTLVDLEISAKIMKKVGKNEKRGAILDRRFEELGLDRCEPVSAGSKEFTFLRDYLVNQTGHTHNIRFTLQDIFRITKHSEDDRFDNSEFANVKSDRRLLWHGSRTTNFGGILSQGLRIAPAEAPTNGYAFGKGIYLADISTKSANYCYATYCKDRTALLLLCEAELGDPMLELGSGITDAAEKAKASGAVSTFGNGMTHPQAWVDAGEELRQKRLRGCQMPDPSKPPTDRPGSSSYLQYNEYICYDAAQVRMRYLFKIKIE